MRRLQVCSGLGLVCAILFLIALPAVAQNTAGSMSDHEMVFWESVRDSNDIDMYRAYIQKYPHGFFVPHAKIKIDALSKNQPNNVNPMNKTSLGLKRLQLRSEPERLRDRDVRKIIKKYNFGIPKRNPDGRFENAFVDNQDGTITDEATGLIWQKSSSDHKLGRDRADYYIKKLNEDKFAGQSTWRLPTLEELLSLMEHETKPPHWFHIDSIFHGTDRWMADRVWSADSKEPAPGCSDGGWLVHFWFGRITYASWGDGGQESNSENQDNFVKAVCTK